MEVAILGFSVMLDAVSYEIHIPQFEGPLDLLLQLIEKEEMDITEVSLAQVTDAFLAHVEAMRGRLELEVVADFLVVAARLLQIKSRVLLPRPSPTPGAAYQDELEEDELVQQLRMYRQYKVAAQWLRERDQAGWRSYVRVARMPRPQSITLDLSEVTLEMLREAAQQALYPSDGPRPEAALQRPRISVTQQIALLRKRLMQWQQVTYHSLLSRTPSRVEAVVTLQAILELVKQCVVAACQEQRFGEIVVERLVPPEQLAAVAVAVEEP